MKKAPLEQLEALGQSLWLDYIRRDLITGGGLARMIQEDGLRGMTSNPALFEKAIAESRGYDAEIEALTLKGKDAQAVYESLSQRDVQGAADLFRPYYDSSGGADGFVSLEVDPHLAHDTKGTLAQARRLWGALDRPNVMIKVPATDEGLPAIQQLTAEGISVNITLLFGLPRYGQVVDAYLAGLEALAARGGPLAPVSSVASFFVSRIDVLVDSLLDKVIAREDGSLVAATKPHGQAAIACAKLAYQAFKERFSSPRFKALAAKGARAQRLLWASTGTKNRSDSDVKYVEALIGPETVNTLPLKTLDAYRDHGDPQPRLEEGLAEAGRVLQSLQDLGIGLDAVARQLEDEGALKFEQAFEKMMGSLGQRSAQARARR